MSRVGLRGFHVVDLTPSPSRPCPTPDDPPLPSDTYAEIWERDGRWLVGPALLGAVVAWVREHGFLAHVNRQDPNAVDMVAPMPHVETTDGQLVPCVAMVPPELRPIFEDRWSQAMTLYGESLLRRMTIFQGRAMTRSTLTEMQAIVEKEDVVRRAAMRPCLHDVVAACLGFSRGVPKGAGMAFVAAS